MCGNLPSRDVKKKRPSNRKKLRSKLWDPTPKKGGVILLVVGQESYEFQGFAPESCPRPSNLMGIQPVGPTLNPGRQPDINQGWRVSRGKNTTTGLGKKSLRLKLWTIWVFPSMVVPPFTTPKWSFFSRKNQWLLGTTILGTPICSNRLCSIPFC